MTPWHRFWFPDAEASRHVQHDAALWSPNALTELHQSFWHRAAEATTHWWQFVSVAWPSLPMQSIPGSVQPLHEPDTPIRPAPAARALQPAKRASPRAQTPRKTSASVKRPRSVSRGK